MSLKENICELCNVPISDNNKETHVQGKKHQLSLHRLQVQQQKEKNGIFVTGFPNYVNQKKILEHFSKYGKIVENFFGDGNRFLIVQYQEASSAEKALKTPNNLFGKHLNVKPRILKEKEKTANIEIEQIVEEYDVITEALKEEETFDGQLRILLHNIQPNWPTMVEKYNHLCYDLGGVLQGVFPGCVVHPFGSTITGLGFNSSDVDVYVMIPNQNTTKEATTLINKSRKALSKSRLFTNIVGIPKAKTPIVKCVHVPTSVQCDFNFKNMLGVCNSQLIKYYLSIHSKLTPLMMVIKFWAKAHEMCSGQKFSNYSLVMLLIFYLQQEPFNFPSVLSLQSSPECTNIQEGWNGGFKPLENFDNTLIKECTIPQLLQGFFSYYANFNYAIHMVCPYLGKVLNKIDFLKTDTLPECFERYKRNLPTSGALKVETPICIQDPFELARNTAAGVSPKCLEDFVGLCTLAVKIFEEKEPTNILHKLFTLEPQLTGGSRCTFSDNECNFKITMGSCLKYLEKQVPEVSTVNIEQNILKLWFETVNQFVLSVLLTILKFDVNAVKDDKSRKLQRLDGQADVHDTSIVDSISFRCKGNYNLWEARKSIAKDLHLNHPPNSTIIDKETALTNYICDVLYKNIQLNDPIVEFTLTLDVRSNPNEVLFNLKNIKSYKSNFKTLSKFFAYKLPAWFGVYEKELNNSCNSVKETEDKQTKGDSTSDEKN